LNSGLGNEEIQRKVKELLQVETPKAPEDSGQCKKWLMHCYFLWPAGIYLFFAIYWLFIGNKVSGWSWLQDDEHEGIRLRHFKVIFFAHFEHW